MKSALIYHIFEFAALLTAALVPILRYRKGQSGWRVMLNGWLYFVIWWDLGEFFGEILFDKGYAAGLVNLLLSVTIAESLRAILVGWIFGILVFLANLLFIGLKNSSKSNRNGKT